MAASAGGSRRGSARLAMALAVTALGVDLIASACRRPAPARGLDASVAHDARAMDAGTPDAHTGRDFGPPNPWGDGALPASSAQGPEADATRATLDAVRATIGFWRIARHAHAYCPNLEDLARTTGSGFDRASMEHDAWGSFVEIECQGAEVHVRSRGPDRVANTADDLVVR